MSGDLGPWLDEPAKPKDAGSANREAYRRMMELQRRLAKPKPDADAAIRGFCQDQAANVELWNKGAWQTDYCQSQANGALAPLPYLAVPRPVRTEVEILRERVAAMEAQIAALTPPPAAPATHPLARAVARWPGSQGFIQAIRWRGW